MRNKFYVLLICYSVLSPGLLAQKINYIFDLLEMNNSWLGSDNAAGLSTLDSIKLSRVELASSFSNGGFKSVYSGHENRDLRLSAKSYQKIKNMRLHGEFAYINGNEQELSYRNVVDPSHLSPYLLIDTIGNTNYLKERVHVNVALASEISAQLSWGTNIAYKVGTAYQNTDPRALNLFQELKVSPGLKLNVNKHKLGLHLFYTYYNEDIEINVIRENTYHTFFQLHGLGNTLAHRANSYLRLYKQHKFGSGFQWQFERDHQSFLSALEVNREKISLEDGRGAGNALWSIVKKDAELNGLDWKLSHIATQTIGNKLQRIRLLMGYQSNVGEEPTQRLETTGETDLIQWITYGSVEKYYALGFQTEAKYEVLKMFDDRSLQSLFIFESKYNGMEEKYYVPDHYLAYQNLTLSVSYTKRWRMKENAVSLKGRMESRFNMGKTYLMDEENPIVQKISIPNLLYLSSNYIAGGVEGGFEYGVKKSDINLHLNLALDYYQDEESKSLALLNLSFGVMF